MPPPETTSILRSHRLGLRAGYKVSVRFMLKNWHSTIGLFAAVFLLLLTVTGLLLMQTDDLGLDAHYVNDSRLLDWYGIRPAPPAVSFQIGEHWITEIGDRHYFNTTLLPNVGGRLVGATYAAEEILLATTTALVLLTENGEIAEKIGPEAGLPQNLIHVGVALDGTVILKSQSRQFEFTIADGEISASERARPVTWSIIDEPPTSIITTLNASYRGTGLTLERIVTDLHTGRIFGATGVWVINLASLALLVLLASGTVLWWLRTREKNAEGYSQDPP